MQPEKSFYRNMEPLCKKKKNYVTTRAHNTYDFIFWIFTFKKIKKVIRGDFEHPLVVVVSVSTGKDQTSLLLVNAKPLIIVFSSV
jgi:flagellar assembly factor FliW